MTFGMTSEMDDNARVRPDGFFKQIGTQLRDVRQRASFAMYALGLMGNAERKSVEPIAAAMCNDPNDCQQLQHALLEFLRVGRWLDDPL